MVTTREKAVESIIESMHAIGRRYMAHHLKARIPASQWAALAVLMRKDRVNLKELASDLNISPSAATQLVDELVSKGFLVRRNNPEDRRASTLILSDKKRKFLQKMKAERMKKFRQMFSKLTDGELIKYAELNKKMAK